MPRDRRRHGQDDFVGNLLGKGIDAVRPGGVLQSDPQVRLGEGLEDFADAVLQASHVVSAAARSRILGFAKAISIRFKSSGQSGEKRNAARCFRKRSWTLINLEGWRVVHDGDVASRNELVENFGRCRRITGPRHEQVRARVRP